MDEISTKIHAMKKDFFWSYGRWIVMGIFLPLISKKIMTGLWPGSATLPRFVREEIRF